MVVPAVDAKFKLKQKSRYHARCEGGIMGDWNGKTKIGEII